jgi:hypothetical protein
MIPVLGIARRFFHSTHIYGDISPHFYGDISLPFYGVISLPFYGDISLLVQIKGTDA